LQKDKLIEQLLM